MSGERAIASEKWRMAAAKSPEEKAALPLAFASSAIGGGGLNIRAEDYGVGFG